MIIITNLSWKIRWRNNSKSLDFSSNKNGFKRNFQYKMLFRILSKYSPLENTEYQSLALWELATNSARQKNRAIIGHWLRNSDRKVVTDRWMLESVLEAALVVAMTNVSRSQQQGSVYSTWLQHIYPWRSAVSVVFQTLGFHAHWAHCITFNACLWWDVE